MPAGGVAGPTSSDLWCAPSACLHLLQLFWVAAGKCWHVVSWAPRLRTSGALPRPARISLQRPAMAPSPGASWLGLTHLVALLALRGLPSAGLLCPSFTPDADKHRAPGLLSQLPGPANRQRRKRLTPALLVAWATCPAPLAMWGRALPTPSWRRHRAAWVPRRPPHRRVQRLRRRCGFAGCRVGEAFNPGPPSPGTPLGGERQPMAVDASGSSGRECSPPPGQRSPDRVFCPVPGCPASMPGSRGWTCHAAMRPHLEDHAAGALDGDVPQAYRARQHLDLCSVCGGRFLHATMVLIHAAGQLLVELPRQPCRCCPRSRRPFFGDSLRCKHPGPAACPQSCPGRLGPMPFTGPCASRQH